MNRLFQKVVLTRLWLTFVVLGLSFLVGAGGTVNLFTMLAANSRLLSEYGWMAAMDGGLRQLGELLLQGAISAAAYVVFKTCEHRLSDWLGHETSSEALFVGSVKEVEAVVDQPAQSDGSRSSTSTDHL